MNPRRLRRIAVLSGLILLGACRIQPAERRSVEGEGVTEGATRVVLLGTGSIFSEPDRMGPAVAVVTGDHAYLVDAGPGVVRRAASAARNGIDALAPDRLDIVFLTVLHSDHTIGLPDLMLTPWVQERAVPLRIFGPRGTRAMTEHLLAAWGDDIRVRLDGADPVNVTGWQTVVQEVAEGVVYRDDNVTVTTFEVPHGAWPAAYGYRFEAADRTVVIVPDGAPSDAVVRACQRCDVLVHGVYSERGYAVLSAERQRYYVNAHTSARELGDIASRAQPGVLVLHHQLRWGTADAELLEEVRRHYEGRVVSGRDLAVY